MACGEAVGGPEGGPVGSGGQGLGFLCPGSRPGGKEWPCTRAATSFSAALWLGALTGRALGAQGGSPASCCLWSHPSPCSGRGGGQGGALPGCSRGEVAGRVLCGQGRAGGLPPVMPPVGQTASPLDGGGHAAAHLLALVCWANLPVSGSPPAGPASRAGGAGREPG